MHQDKKIVRMTLIVFALSLFFVYILYFWQQATTTLPDSIDTDLLLSPVTVDDQWIKWAGNDTIVTDSTDFSAEESGLLMSFVATGAETDSSSGDADSLFLTTLEQTWSATSSWWFARTASSFTTTIQQLPDTQIVLDRPEIVEVLWVDYEYILRDEMAYYVYLGTWFYDFNSLIRKLGGNAVELTTETAIVTNRLFGDKVLFLNLPGITYVSKPVYLRKIVFMVVYIQDDRWLLQVDFDQYHISKDLFKQKFEQIYLL